MPFLLGAFGARYTLDYLKKLSDAVAQHAQPDTVHTVPLDHGVIIAGYRPSETYHYDHILPLHANQGIVVGKVFDRARDNQSVYFSPDQSHAIVNNPHLLASHYWGRYAGVLINQATKTITLVRDPQGLSTLFYHASPDGILFSTELALLYQALEVKPSIDLNFFAQHLIHTNQALPVTPFEGITELLPGMSLRVDSTGTCTHELLWDVTAMHGSFITDENSFEEKLLTTLRSCTKAWAGNAPGVCVELSGGADSSGVMLLLRDLLPADKKLIAVNYIDTKTPSSNEIEHAQEIANACDAQLHFLDWQTTSLLDKLPTDFLPNRPSTLLLFGNIRKQLHEIADQNNCPEIMNGQGGDHVFCAPPPKQALADYWLDRGLRGSTKPLHELSGIYRMPWLSLIGDNAKAIACYLKKSRYAEKKQPTCLDKTFAHEVKQHDFYLNDILRKMHPGKAARIESLCHAVAYSERNQTTTNRCLTHPLLSQPIVELGLRIPTYQSFADGYDRIFFRRAITQLKQTKALWRRIKGQTTSSMIKQCAFHANDMRDIVLNGKLANSGIIDKQWVDEQIIKKQHGQVDNLWPLLHLLTGQLWLNQWNLR